MGTMGSRAIHGRLIEAVYELLRSTPVSDLTARLHPREYDDLVMELDGVDGREREFGVSLAIQTPGGRMEVVQDPHLQLGHFRVLGNNYDGMVRLIEGSFAVDESTPIESSDFARAFQSFAKAPMLSEVRTVARAIIPSFSGDAMMKTLEQLLQDPPPSHNFTTWERKFLRDMLFRLQESETLTDKQQDVLSRVVRKHLPRSAWGTT